MSNPKLSLYSYIACALLIIYTATVFCPKWNAPEGESCLGYDAGTYYWYLPATIIYKDLKKQKFGDSIIAQYKFSETFTQSYVHKSGNRIMTYTAGVALMQLPGFMIAHALAKPMGYAADGFSLPYRIAIIHWTLLWVLIGLWQFRKLLRYYYSDATVAIVLLLLVFGSNYLNYNAIDVTLTHSWLFTGYVFLMLATRHFYLQPSTGRAAVVGLITGMLILIRPSEMIAALIPLLWGMEGLGLRALKDRLIFFRDNYGKLLTAIGCVVAVGMIQVTYWLYITGEPFVYSYTNNQGFSWKKPHFFNYTFSYRSGWLVYTPLLFFAFIGLLPFLRYGKNKVAIITFFLLNYYIIAAWDVWWYGGMGGRAMVQSYAVTFFIIAAMVEWVRGTKLLKWPVFGMMIVCVYVNLWFTYNAHSYKGLYVPGAMTRAYYWAVVGRYEVPKYTKRYLDTDDFFLGEPRDMQLVYNNDFEHDSDADSLYVISGKRALNIDVHKEYSSFTFSYQPGESTWLRTTADVNMDYAEWEMWKMIQLTTRFKNGDSIVKVRMLRINHAVDSTKGSIYFDVKIPQQPFDSIELLFWNPGSEYRMVIDNIKTWSFKE